MRMLAREQRAWDVRCDARAGVWDTRSTWGHEEHACDMGAFACTPRWAGFPTPQIRTQDLALFEELQRGVGEPPSLTVQDPTLGTVACRLGAASETLARKYFYLNGAHGSEASRAAWGAEGHRDPRVHGVRGGGLRESRVSARPGPR